MTPQPCTSCEQPITFAPSAATGQSMPFDAPDDTLTHADPGVFVIYQGRAYGAAHAIEKVAGDRNTDAAGAAAWLDANKGWRVSHFATCDDPRRFRKGGKR